MRVLITDATGFVAGHLSRELQDAGHLVAGIDIAENRDGHFGHVRDAAEKHKAEVLIHLEDSSYDSPESHPYGTVGDTAGLTAEVAKMCGDMGVRLVYASTDEIYGENLGTSVSNEEGPFGLPGSTYALGKLMGESLGLLYAPDGLTVLRISSSYGPGLTPSKSEILDLLWRAQNGQPMLVRAGHERSWCWVGDLVRAIRITMEKGEGVYNVGRDDDMTSEQEVAELACTITSADKDLIQVSPTPGTVRRVSTQKLQRLGWEPQVSLYEGMEMTLNGWLKNPDPATNVAAP